MNVRRQPSFRDIMFAINGSIIPKIARRLLAIALVSIVAILASMQHPGIFARFSAVPFTLIGIALSVFMSFRNNACYARWWEGRQLWGELIIASRSFARQVSTLPPAEQHYLLTRVCGFSKGLATRLRGSNEATAIDTWCDLGESVPGPNPTNGVLYSIGERCLDLSNRGVIGPMHYSVLEAQLSRMAVVQGGCERILSTPVPFSYSLLLHRTALVFCVTLPFALAGELGWWTLLPVILVAYTFFGLDALGHQLEDPFSPGPNALPLDSMCQTIEREVRFVLGDVELPPQATSDENA
jgi:putative membrane protein